MKVSVKDSGKCEKVLSIQIPPERIRSEYEKYYASVGKTARIPGFRPGRAPKEVVAMHYAGEAKETVLRNLIHEATYEALEKQKIDPLYYPSINKVDFEGEKLSFDAVVELRPEVKLSAYKGLSVKKELASVEDSAVEETITHVRESYSKYVPVENRSVQEGDFLVCDMDYEVEGKKMESRKDDWFEVNTKRAQLSLVQGLIGMNCGETRTVDVPFPKEFPVKELAGKTGKFTVHVKEIKTRELPALNDEWVASLGESKTVDEFQKHIREDLLKTKEKEVETKFENGLMESLLNANKCELPANAVERRLGLLIEETKKKLQYQGESNESIEKRKDDLNKELRPEAEKQLKLAFIFQAIAKAEHLEVSPEDTERKFTEMAERAKISLEKVKKYYEESEERKDNLTNQIQNEKVLDFIKQNAKVQKA